MEFNKSKDDLNLHEKAKLLSLESNAVKNHPNPREKAKFLSVLFWWWIIDLFKKGYTEALTFQDLYEPLKKDRSTFLGNKLEKQWNAELNRTKKVNNQPNLYKLILFTFRKEILYLGIIHFFIDVIFRLALPLILGLFLEYFKPEMMTTFKEALLYFGALIAMNLIIILLENHGQFQANHLAGRIRISLCSLIYKKALKLNSAVLNETSTGKIVNLLANDINRFQYIMLLLNSMWTAPLSTIIVGFILFNSIHFAGLIGIVVMLTTVPIQVATYHLSSKYRLDASIKTDERVRLVEEIISGVQVIKMYAWEKPFNALVEHLRLSELNVIKKSAYVRGLFLTVFISIARVALYFTIISMWMFDEKITVDKIFVAGSYYNLLASSITGKFVRSFAELAESKVSITRIQSFLLMDEFQGSNIVKSKNIKIIKCEEGEKKYEGVNNAEIENVSEETCIKINNVTAKWYPNSLINTLEDVSVELEWGKLYGVIGTVASGKSSFLSAILGEINIMEGNISLKGSISYAPQDAWVFGASIRENIIFGEEFDEEKYLKVLDVCSLAEDLVQFSNADHTLMDEKGSSLSGGQRARVSLARAIYKDVDIYLLDDPLSAVDANVGKYLFQKCILQYLKGKTRILVTHQLQNIKYVDGIIFFNEGKMQYYKDYQSLLIAHAEYNNLLASDNVYECDNGNSLEKIEMRSRFTSIEMKIQKLDYTNKMIEGKGNLDLEKSSKGVIEGSVFLKYLQLGSSFCSSIMVVILFILTQFLASLNDFYISVIINAEEYRNYYITQNNDSYLFNNKKAANAFKGNIYSRESYVGYYTVIVAVIFCVGLLRCFMFFNACLRSGKRLHNLALWSIIHAPMQFFEANPSGRILNRFAKEIAIVDEILPKTILDAGQVLLTLLGAFMLTCMVNPYFLLPGFFINTVSYWIKKVYLKSSKDLKRLEGMTQSPVFTHLNVTINGITTIRGLKAQTKLNEQFNKFLDNHTMSWYLYTAGSFAYSFVLDICSLTFIICITFSFLVFKEHFHSGEVGLAITQMLWISTVVQWGMRQIAEVSNQMTSVERIIEYKQILPEKNFYRKHKKIMKKVNVEDKQNLLSTLDEKTENWIHEGNISFKNVSMTYTIESKSVLKNLNFEIKAMEKIGIVGRTGCGKSSLICAIFRLANLSGVIEIDEIDTSTVSLQDLRSHISIIPQDPVLFSGTLRCNLDPFNEFSDKDLWKALEEVKLKDTIIVYENGLNYHVHEKGMNFSVGQRQLICLARAILRNNRILAVDEATANVDPQTDFLIQNTIRRKFASCTILTIAHRLNTIIDSDKIMVLDRGHLVEFDHPYMLLQRKDSHFNLLVKENGDVIHEKFLNLAEESYNKNYNYSN